MLKSAALPSSEKGALFPLQAPNLVLARSAAKLDAITLDDGMRKLTATEAQDLCERLEHPGVAITVTRE